MNDDFEDVQIRLHKIKEQFECLICEIQRSSLDKHGIKTKYGILKVKLRSESNFFETRKGQTQATEYETAFYYPAVTEAYLELKVKIGTSHNEKLLQCLVSGEDYISYYLSQMKIPT